MTREEITSALVAGGYLRGRWDLDDLLYDPFSKDFVLTAHQDWVRSLPPELRDTRDLGGGKTILIPKGIPEVYDCDNHVRSFANFIDEAMALDAVKRGVTRGNPASGKFGFTLDGGEGHARMWMIELGTGKAISFDPGIGEFTTESPSELASIALNGGESV